MKFWLSFTLGLILGVFSGVFGAAYFLFDDVARVGQPSTPAMAEADAGKHSRVSGGSKEVKAPSKTEAAGNELRPIGISAGAVDPNNPESFSTVLREAAPAEKSASVQ